MRHQLGIWAVLPLVVWQVVQAQTYKCDDTDGKGRGYTINDNIKHDCQEGTFCYQLGKAVYCGVGSSDPVVPESMVAVEAEKAAPSVCAKDGTATCKQADGHGAGYIRCVSGETQDFKCGGGSVCYQDGEGIVCGASSSAKACTPGAFKCNADDGASADFSRCIGGEQVALTCGEGLNCYQEGPFHVRCASDAEGNARAVYPAYPITSAESDSATCAANSTLPSSSGNKGYEAPVAPITTLTTIYNTVSGMTTTTTTVYAKPSLYTMAKNDDRKANGPMLVRSNARPSGKNMVEIDVTYNPADVAQYQRYGAATAGAFDQPDAFSREITNYAMSQGYGASSTSFAYASTTTPYYASYSTADSNAAPAYPSPNMFAAQPTYNTAYSAQPTYNTAYSAQSTYAYAAPSPYDSAAQPLALNGAYATVVPDNIQLPQLIYSLQNAMQLSKPSPAPYQPGPPPPPGPVYITVVPPTIPCPTVVCPTSECPTKPTCPKAQTHTVFISIETNCEKPTKPTCPSEPTCPCEHECCSESKHKHKHKHKHQHKKKKDDDDDECSTTTSCKPTTSCETTSSESCESTSKKHKHKHEHKHKHKHTKKDDDSDSDSDCESSSSKHGDCDIEDCGECCECFGRAVVSITSCDEEDVTTLGKKMFACMSSEETADAEPESVDDELNAVVHNAATSSESCESPEPTSCATTHTAIESVETGCKCQCGGKCKCGDKCKCGNQHTVIVSVDSSCPKPTSCTPTCPENTHTVIESIECSCITPSPKNTHTVIESIECSCITPSPKNTHTVIESIECNCITPSPQNTHTIIESIECICVKPTKAAPKHTHTVFKSIECGCGPSCGKKTHAILESVECGCASSSDTCPTSSSCEPTSEKSTHFVFELVESGCASSSSSCKPTSSQKTHVVFESVECGCASSSKCKPTSSECKPTCSINTHTVFESVECGCASSSKCKPTSSECKPTSSQNTHTVFESVECGCASSSDSCKPTSSDCKPECSQNTHTVFESVECGCKSSSSCESASSQNTHTVFESVECSCESSNSC